MARDIRVRNLKSLDVSEDALAQLCGPIGLLPSSRDARTLAISVLAEVVAVMNNETAVA